MGSPAATSPDFADHNVCGYLQPDEGQAQVDGLDVLTDTLEVQKRIGYLPEEAPLYPELSVQAYLKMIADLRQQSDANAREIRRVVEEGKQRQQQTLAKFALQGTAPAELTPGDA